VPASSLVADAALSKLLVYEYRRVSAAMTPLPNKFFELLHKVSFERDNHYRIMWRRPEKTHDDFLFELNRTIPSAAAAASVPGHLQT